MPDVVSVWLARNGYHVDTAPDDDFNPHLLLDNRFNYWASSCTLAGFLNEKLGLSERIFPLLTFGRTDLYLACNLAVSPDIIVKLNEVLR